MKAISVVSCSPTLFPQNRSEDANKRCLSVSSPNVVKSELRSSRPRSLSASNRNVPSFGGVATESGNVQGVVPTSVPVRVARELLQAGHHYLDVRTNEEFSAGHVAGAVNVPFMTRVGPGMSRNPNFVEEVLTHFGKDDEIIVGCQLGKRSLMAASQLLSAGFTGITDMAGGYDAWLQNGLPTE
ncbi:hypothetical protein BUALT_Bualt11G0042600 [Buddleja alternifolia]|uniref:Rhodanese domain-containing protein n=1 Tax=Buddleja alternifolia TaxID=168488 RepID=A0AAV6WU53_9LAMI|nr:hypothetical protein BUALT_Bualt11G0042600 [Buddleja alternifolia]